MDIVKTEADMSMLNTSISVGNTIKEKETNTSACYTVGKMERILRVKMN